MSEPDNASCQSEDLLTLLESLSSEEWRKPSLCAGWSVHDVVAHLLSYEELGARQLAARFAKGWFLTDRVNGIGLAEYRTRSPEELVALLRQHLTPRGLTAGMGGAIGLTDGMIHQQDIRRPLGRPRAIPVERLVPALWTALFAPVVGGRGAASRRAAHRDRPRLGLWAGAGSPRNRGSPPDGRGRSPRVVGRTHGARRGPPAPPDRQLTRVSSPNPLEEPSALLNHPASARAGSDVPQAEPRPGH